MATFKFEVKITETARRDLNKALRKQPEKKKKVAQAVKRMKEFGPSYPSFHTHSEKGLEKNADPVYISYIENNTPGVWRT